MTRFNFLREHRPQALEALRPGRIPQAIRTPLAAVVTAVIVVAVWFAIERLALSRAQDELQRQKLRLARTQVELRALKLRRERVDVILALDERLRAIRRSGAVNAHALADVADHIPQQAWLTSISHVDTGLEIDGRAIGFDGVSTTLGDLTHSTTASAPALVHASKEGLHDRNAVVAFTMRVAVPR
jgi:Tfp pilus assembly protein PilN